MATTHQSSTKDVIYQSSASLIAERGYHGTSLRDIAQRVGIQMSSLYYHFASKEELLLAIMRETMSSMHNAVEPAIAAAEGPQARLVAGIRAHVLFHGDRRNETIVTDSELRALDAAGLKEIVALRDNYAALFLEILETGRKEGVFSYGDSHIATNAMMTMCAGVAAWFRDDGRLQLSEVADELAAMCLASVSARQ